MRKIYRGFQWAFDGSIQNMIVEGGRVVARGPEVDDPEAEAIDCSGKWLSPGLIDNHCHILPSGLDLLKLHLGNCSTREQVLDAVRDRHASLPAGDWLMAVHYDQTKFPDNRHLTRHDLDSISAERPILLRHVSGHASIANSAALVAAKVGDDEPDPAGGEFVRETDGRPNGVLLETAHERVTAAAPDLTLDQMVEAILAISDRMSSEGLTCATDMMTGRFNLEQELLAYRIAAERGAKIRFRLFVQWAEVFGPRGMGLEKFQSLHQNLPADVCKVAGIKIFSDGAIGSATAAIYGKYDSNPEGHENQGQLIYNPDRLHSMVRTAHEAGYSVAIHAIGDRATDLVMDAYEALGDCSMHRIEHAMILSDEQIERLARLNLHVTMQPEFLIRFGHAYRKQLGDARAARLKRMQSIRRAGLRLSLSSDRPIVAGAPASGFAAAVNRPEGFDPSEALTPAQALEGYTKFAAAANFDAEVGELLSGQWADMTWYSADPRNGHLEIVPN